MADEYVLLPRGKTKVLQAEDKNYKRGLLVRLKKDGGYRVAYWYEEPDKPNVVEVLVDGESIKKDARVVEFKFHPQNYYEEDDIVETINEKITLFLEKNVPTDASKWSYYKSQAKKKFDVYPSAYANGWAAKQYKAAGGGWKKSKTENKGLWHNINAKKKRGEKSSPKGSKAYKAAKAAGDRLNRNETYTSEYNVENYHDIKEFVEFMTSYKPDINEAEYQGRKVKLGKPMQGDTKKFKVYVKNPKGNVVKVNFGQGGDAKGGTMRIRKNNPKARANFRARHNCDSPGPRHKARYWSCRKW
jgi:hypothetical protein|tara:strand:- start:991 stop:1893 length:903 start_codon:yes stop_codon:yes gene_type:complete